MTINNENRQFYYLIKHIINTPEFQQMAKYRHHGDTSIYDHSLKVAYLCYKYHLKHNCNINMKELVHAALLHDYFLYDRINKTTEDGPRNRFIHLFKHPLIALENASHDYILTYDEQNAIKCHMFPIVPIPPTTKCGWIVCWYDKVASVGDYLNLDTWKKTLKETHPQIFIQNEFEQ